MSIELAEKLKQKLTDKWVVVDPQVAELRRFAKLNGKVMTVNMNGRALVKFDGPVDIGWYDIDPAYLTVIDAPRPKVVAPPAKAEPKAAAPAASTAAAPAKPAATGGGSPLDKIRAQQAAKAGGAPAPTTGAKLSPMEMIRQQQAAKAAGTATPPAAESAPAPAAETAPAAPAPAEKPAAPVSMTGPDGKPLSKLEMIRMQGAKKPS